MQILASTRAIAITTTYHASTFRTSQGAPLAYHSINGVHNPHQFVIGGRSARLPDAARWQARGWTELELRHLVMEDVTMRLRGPLLFCTCSLSTAAEKTRPAPHAHQANARRLR